MMTVQQAFELAVRHQLEGRLAEAAELYQQILAVQPGQVETLHCFAVLLHQTGQRDQALALIQRALTLAPSYAAAFMNFGNMLKDGGRLDEAVAAYHRAIALQPDFAEAHHNLANALREAGRVEEAEAACRRALGIRPDLAEGWNNLAAVMAAQGSLDEAEAAYRKALELRPYLPTAQSSLIYTLLLRPRMTDAALEAEQACWNERFGGPSKQFFRPHANDCDPDRPLRIGYVSADFREHVVGKNLLPLFKNHDRSRFEIGCFSGVVRPDGMTEEFQQHADQWWNTAAIPDGALTELVRQERIDILVDLSQHTIGNRLLVFARQPAPVQVSFAGYPASTGLDAIGYRLSDRWLEGMGEKMADGQWQTACGGAELCVGDSRRRRERVFLLDSFWCYEPEKTAAPVGELPARAQGWVTFGALHNFCKVNEPMLELWARVLQNVPDSRLLLLRGGGNYAERTRQFFERHGIDVSRVEFLDVRARGEYLKNYHRVDMVLDTFPYNGHTTNLDALWMGVPVISLAGETPVARGGLSQLSNLGLTELVAHSEDAYVEMATRLARDLSRLAELRATLRPRMEASVLVDATRFTRQIEEAYRAMWRRWCTEGTAP